MMNSFSSRLSVKLFFHLHFQGIILLDIEFYDGGFYFQLFKEFSLLSLFACFLMRSSLLLLILVSPSW